MSSTIARHSVAVCVASLSILSPSLKSQTITFGPVQTVPIAGSSTYIVTPLRMSGADTDLYISSGSGNLIYTGNGKGSFSGTPVKVAETGASAWQASPVFYDVNGDGFGDEVYAYAGFNDPGGADSYGGAFAVLLGDGKGHFTETSYFSVGGDEGGGTLVAGDFNHDGKIDFALIYAGAQGDAYGSAITVFLDQGNGKFLASAPINIAGFPPTGGMIAGDFNGDGKLDLAWTNQIAKAGTKNQFQIHCMMGNGDGTFSPDTVCYTLNEQPFAIASADFNRDGKADLVVSAGPQLNSSGETVAGAKPRLITLLARGAGSFFWSSSVNTTNIATRLLQVTDLNADSKPDVVADGAFLFENRGNGVFDAPLNLNTGAVNTIVPVVSGGLPAVFYLANGAIDYRLNTSVKQPEK